MATGVNIKMGVSGVAQFKQSITQAKQNLKTLDAQLQLTEKQYKATGDAETYMQQRTEQLKAKLEEQKSVAAAAEQALATMTEKGVDKSSKAYQEMIRTLAQAKGDMIDTEQQMMGVADAGEEAANGVDAMNYQLKNIGSQVSFGTVTKGINEITSGMEAAAKKAVQFGKAIIRGSMDAASYADDILTRASRYGDGYDAELVQQMDNVAAFIDTDTDTIINAQKRLKKAMGNEGSKETMGAFAALGIDPSNEDWEDVFWKAGEALKGLTDDVAQEEYATRLFGRSWDDLNPLFDAGRSKYEQMLSEQTVLTNAQIEALGKEDDAMQKMQQQIDLLKNQFWAGLAPAITDATNALSGLLEQFNLYLQTDEGQQMLTNMGNAVSGLFEELSNIDPQEVISGFSGVFKSITEGFQWIYDHKQDIINALEGIAIGWGALKLTGGALKVLELISGIKGLSGAGAAAGAAASGTQFGTSWGTAFGTAVIKSVPWLAALGIISHISPSADNDLDLLYDEKGNPTTAGKEYEASLPTAGRKYSAAQEAAIQELWDKYRTGNLTQNDLSSMSELLLNNQTFNDLMNSMYQMTQAIPEWKNLRDLPDDFFLDRNTGNTGSAELPQALTGLPGDISRSVAASMSNVKVYMDGSTVGYLVAPYVGQYMANSVNNA